MTRGGAEEAPAAAPIAGENVSGITGTEGRLFGIGVSIDVTFTRGGQRALLTMLSGSRVYEVDVERGRTVSAVGVGSRHHRIALSADERAYYLLSMDGEVSRVSRATSAIERTASLDAILRRIVLSPDGRRAYVANEVGWVDVIR